jgi:hypothetical protein
MKKLNLILTLIFGMTLTCLFATNAVADHPYCPMKITFSDVINFNEFLGIIERYQSDMERKQSVSEYFKSKKLSKPILMSENYFNGSFHRSDLKFDRDKLVIEFTFGNGISYYEKDRTESEWGDTTKKLLQEWSSLTNSLIKWEDCDHYGNATIYLTK